MLKVLITDGKDEICHRIQESIDWDALGLEFIGTSSNSEEAFSMIQEYTPDIVITDVCMPDMDSLSLIREVWKNNIQTTFIIVTEHQQFEYAYSALKYGVKDYLLKPIQWRELNSILKKISLRIHQERTFIQEKKQDRNQPNKQTDLLRSQFVSSLCTLSQLTEDRTVINEHFGFSFMPGTFYAAVCKVSVARGSVGQVNTDFVCNHISELILESFSEVPYEHACHASENTVTLILNTPHTAPHDLLRRLLGQFHLYVAPFECYHINLSVSDAVSDFNELPIAVRQAHALIDNRLFQSDRQLLLSNTRPLVSTESAEELFPIPARNLMRRQLNAFHISAFRTHLLDLFQKLNNNPICAAASYYRLSNYLSDFVFQFVTENGWSEQRVREEKILLEALIQNACSAAELVEILTEQLGSLLIRCEETRRLSASRPIRIAREYILTHYNEALTLEKVAKKTGLSPSYFSLLFKRELNISFSDYLVEIRIESARKMLEETDESISCIAEKVGYQDAKYFSRLFQRMIGVSPSKYRKISDISTQ